MAKRKITILETHYDEKRDLVQWLVKDMESKKQIVLCWPGQDLGPAVGVNKHLPPELIKEFCENITNKTINLEANPSTKEIDVKDFSNKNNEELQKAHDVLDQYPFHEILESLQEQGQFKAADQPEHSNHYFSLSQMWKNKDGD